jgi:hypothetical protein
VPVDRRVLGEPVLDDDADGLTLLHPSNPHFARGARRAGGRAKVAFMTMDERLRLRPQPSLPRLKSLERPSKLEAPNPVAPGADSSTVRDRPPARPRNRGVSK